MISAGIDAGSRSIKTVLFDTEQRRVLASRLADQGVDQGRLAGAVFADTLRDAGLEPRHIAAVVATGYGRNAVPFADTAVTEITCHAQGVRHLAADARTVLEIGGQDSKFIRLDPDGRVRDFAMNDRCAAGTGRFLEIVAARLGVALADLGDLGRHSTRPALISSMCVVFAETEIIGLLAQGTAPADIAAGVQNAIAQRAVALAGRRFDVPIYFTGGVALQPGMVRAVSAALGGEVRVPPVPQFTGALGAALQATRRFPGTQRLNVER
jgi:predicted CoA-substrate-specific enzyme activase